MRHPKLRKIAAVALLALSLWPLSSSATAKADKFPRVANYYLKAGIGIPSSDEAKLAKYDVIILPAEAQVFNPNLFGDIRQVNPDVVILAYVPTKSYALVWSDSLHETLKRDIDAHSEWRLRSPDGNAISVWPNTFALNIGSGWSDYLAEYTADKIMATGNWDGVFFDEESSTISWLNGGSLDLNNDGTRDDAGTADRLWKDGMTRLLKGTRDRIGSGKVIIVNGDSDSDLAKYVNGRMFETFPTPWEGNGSWQSVMSSYLNMQGQVGYAPLFIINGNTSNTGKQNDYAKVRFGLASALLGDGYFGFDYGDQDHGQFWMYDEYNAYLGKPLGPATNLSNPSSNAIVPGIWKREFEHGVVLVNSTGRTQTAELDRDFEHLHGTQDPSFNNGQITSSVDLGANDGAIMLRPLDTVTNSSYRNGAFVRVFGGDGGVRRNGFFAYDKSQRGGTILATFDSSLGSGLTLSAKANRLELRDGAGNVLKTAYPFGQDWRYSVGFSIGRVGGKTYVAAAAGPGGLPLVRMYSDALDPITDSWSAYAPNFHGGVNVGVGDIDNDGSPDLVTGPGAGGGPHVRVFGLNGAVKSQFFAYAQSFKGGVNVGVGDIDGDGATEIITGTGFGGTPEIRIFQKDGRLKKSFFAYDAKRRGGVRVAAVDLDGDGFFEILGMSNDVFTL